MARDLNARQLKFAAAVASGKTQVEAYKEAGYENGKPKTMGRNARRLVKKAEMRARIEKMRLQLLPDPGDVREIRAHAMAVIVELSLKAEAEKVRLQAAMWLHEETGRQMAERERLEAGRREPVAEAGEKIMMQLESLYRKALPAQEPLVEEVSDGTADGSAENLPQVAEPLVEVAVEDEPVCGDEALQPGETAAVEVPPVAEKLNPPVQFRRERIPGYFPARYRRVPVEP